MNTKFEKLLKEFATCYNSDVKIVEPNDPDLTYIDFGKPTIKEYLTPFADEIFVSKDNDETIFEYNKEHNCWYSIEYLQNSFQKRIKLLYDCRNNEAEITFNMYNKCCYCFNEQQERIDLDFHSIDDIQYIVFKTQYYKNLFVDYMDEQSEGEITLLQEDNSDMCFMWSKKRKQWESFHHYFERTRDFQDIWDYLITYQTQHNKLEIL